MTWEKRKNRKRGTEGEVWLVSGAVSEIFTETEKVWKCVCTGDESIWEEEDSG